MNLPPEILRAIKRKGYRLPTPIQRRALPPALAGHDIVAMARTGSGKTAAFAIPVVAALRRHSPRAGARAVILSPARELALQTHAAVRDLAKYTDLRIAALVGGDALEHQFAELASNPDVLVATPGRLLHLLSEVPGMSLQATKIVVFDEADRLFEMGFAPQLAQLLQALPRERQALLFSATMPSALAEFAAAGLRDPEVVRLDAEARLAPGLRMAFYSVRSNDKPAALRWLLREAMSGSVAALAAAEELTYVTGTTFAPDSAMTSSIAASTSAVWAISAMLHPAFMCGRITTWSGAERMSADSAMKCTPQKTMYLASFCAAASCESFRLSPVKSANWMTSWR